MVLQQTESFTECKFIFNLPGDKELGVTYKVKNRFADRYIYFIADPPHLMKTARNCLAHSGHGRGTRFMWNNGFYLLWDHIKYLYRSGISVRSRMWFTSAA